MTELLHDQAPLPNPEPGPPRRPWYLRAAAIIPLVLVVVAAAVVATVLVATRSHSGGAGPTSQAPAAAPVPLHATATSAMTGAPLAITLKLPDGTGVPVEANGTVTTDRAGPGDQVQVIATGYVTAPATVGADRTITVILQPTLATVTAQLNTWADEKKADAITNWVFSPATGLRFAPSQNRRISGDLRWAVVLDVVGKDATVEGVMIPGSFAAGSHTEGLFSGPPTQVTIAGQQVWHGQSVEGRPASEWMRESLEITVYGPDLATVDGVLTAIIAAQPAQ